MQAQKKKKIASNSPYASLERTQTQNVLGRRYSEVLVFLPLYTKACLHQAHLRHAHCYYDIRSIQRRWDMVDCMLQSYSLSFEDQ